MEQQSLHLKFIDMNFHFFLHETLDFVHFNQASPESKNY
jgi:hypothetical protein